MQDAKDDDSVFSASAKRAIRRLAGREDAATTRQQAVGRVRRQTIDTGSPEVQIAILTRRINGLTEHLKKNQSDTHSRRGLMLLIKKRRSMLDHVKDQDKSRYQALIEQLGLRK